jgi:hypothetical protein
VAFVRCEDPSTGHQFTLSEKAAKSLGLEILDRPAVDGTGRVLPAKPRTTKGGNPSPKPKPPAQTEEKS